RDEAFLFLWRDEPELLEEARATFEGDIRIAIDELRAEVGSVPQEKLLSHGLLGRPLRFKFRVLDRVTRQWRSLGNQLNKWLEWVLATIDVILDSLIDAAGGVGGALKEFKEALSALASIA